MAKNINYWLTPVLVVLCLNSFAQESPKQFSLTELINSAVQNNYLLQANQRNTLIKQAEIEILRTSYQPKVSASATFSYWKFLLPNKQKLLGDALTDMYTDVQFYQTVYDWGENKAKKSVVDDEILLNSELRRQIQTTVIWGVADAYLELLKAKAEVEVHKNALNQLKSHLQYVNNLYSIGKVSGVDVLKVNVQISVEEKNLLKSQTAVQNQLIKLKRLCYLDDNAAFDVEDIAADLYKQSNSRIIDATNLYGDVLTNHPAIKANMLRVGMENKQKDIYKLQSRPELYSYGVGSWEHGYIPFGDNFNYNIGVGIRYTIPYWGGSSYKHRMVQSQHRIEQLGDEKNQAFTDIKKDIDLTINNLNDIKIEISSNEKIIKLAEETLMNATVKYQAGQGTIIDILDAQSILTETTIAHSKSTISYLQAMARLHYLTGNDNHPFQIEK